LYHTTLGLSVRKKRRRVGRHLVGESEERFVEAGVVEHACEVFFLHPARFSGLNCHTLIIYDRYTAACKAVCRGRMEVC